MSVGVTWMCVCVYGIDRGEVGRLAGPLCVETGAEGGYNKAGSF